MEALYQFLIQNGELLEYKKGDVIIQEGDISKRFYYLKSGLLRGCTNNLGREVTFQFLFENSLFCCAESFFTHTPSQYSVVAIEKSTILSVTKDEIEFLQNDNLFMRDFNQFLIKRLLSYQQLLIARIQDKPEIRYKKLLEDHPEIVFRVPQHYIASYLGITPVSLSRIRNRR